MCAEILDPTLFAEPDEPKEAKDPVNAEAGEIASADPANVDPESEGTDSATVDGRTHIDDLNRTLELDVPESEEYETVGGLLFSRMGRVPAAGEHVDLTGVRSSCFMLMYGVVWVSLTWMYFSEMRKQPLLGKTAQRLQGE